MRLHAQAEAVVELVASWQKEQGAPPRMMQSIAKIRDLTSQMAPLRWRGPAIEMTSINELSLPARGGERRVRIYRPGRGPGQFTLIYVHGGGYVVGGIDASDPECRRFAAALGCDVVSISYRLAPEHPWPAGIDDGEDIFAAITGGSILGLKPPFALAGVSAGAGLATAMCRRAILAGTTPPCLLVLLSPWLDMTLTNPSTELYATGYQLEREMLAIFRKHYVPASVPHTHPELSPTRHPVPKGWPETVLFAADCDPLADDATLFARRLSEGGVPHHLTFARGMQHGCHGWWQHLPVLKPNLDWLDATIRNSVAL